MQNPLRTHNTKFLISFLLFVLLLLPINTNMTKAIVDSPNTTVILSHLKTYDVQGPPNETMSAPYGICEFNNHILVSEYSGDRVKIFDYDGNYIANFGSEGSGNGEFDGPIGMTSNSTHLFVTERHNSRVQIFNSNYEYVDQFGSIGSGDGEFLYPRDIQVNSPHIFVLDADQPNIEIFDLSGNFVSSFNLIGKSYGFDLYEDHLYVTLYDNEWLVIYDTSGNNPYVLQGLDLTYPGDIEVYDDFMYVANQTSLNIYHKGGTPQQFVKYGFDLDANINPAGILVTNNRLYTPDDWRGNLVIFNKNVQDISAQSGTSSIRVSWGSPNLLDNVNVEYFNIYRKTTNGSYDIISQVYPSNMQFIDEVIQSGIEYYYVVTAVNNFGETAYSEEVSAIVEARMGDIIIDSDVITHFETLTESISDDGFVSFNLTLIPVVAVLIIFLRKRK